MISGYRGVLIWPRVEKEEDDSRVWLLASDVSMIEVEEEADLRSVNVFDGI